MGKLVLNISDAPLMTKIIPFIGAAGGIGYAIYKKKECIGCFLGFGLSGLLLASIPLFIEAKSEGNKLVTT